MVHFNTTCNATLDDMRIGSSEVPVVGNITFHNLGLIIAAAASLIACLLSFYLMWMHALHYTKPVEQRHIIRILFMVPIYAISSFLSFWFYWHAIYYQTISACYEAFAIASFFALLCSYIAPNLHDQKEYFRSIEPKAWVLPVNWFAACCGGQRGIWRTPRSGLTWFNVIWSGIYQYCFIRVAMTIVAVVSQYFGVYCESSDSPVFAHIWVIALESVAVTIAMYCVIQFYLQLRKDLAAYGLLLKVLSIKLVIFLSFWQTSLISVLTSTLNIVQAGSTVAYPDLVVGIPSLLLCLEMAIFAVLHLWAFPWRPYSIRGNKTKSLSSDSSDMGMDDIGPKQGGILGWRAVIDAMNPYDLIKAFGRGTRWLFVGRRLRHTDSSYKSEGFGMGNENDMTLQATPSTSKTFDDQNQLPIASEFRRSVFGMPADNPDKLQPDEGQGLIAHAQPNPINPARTHSPIPKYDMEASDTNMMRAGGNDDDMNQYSRTNPAPGNYRGSPQIGSPAIGMAFAESESYQSRVPAPSRPQYAQRPSEQWANAQSPRRVGTPDDSASEYSIPHNANPAWPLPPHNRI